MKRWNIIVSIAVRMEFDRGSEDVDDKQVY